MEALYYIPLVYNDDLDSCCVALLLQARAECLEWFHCAHPEVFLAVGPLLEFANDNKLNSNACLGNLK